MRRSNRLRVSDRAALYLEAACLIVRACIVAITDLFTYTETSHCDYPRTKDYLLPELTFPDLPLFLDTITTKNDEDLRRPSKSRAIN